MPNDRAISAETVSPFTPNQGRTTVVVTHRIDTAMRADRIAMLHRGRVVATGTHAELMACSPEYAGLVQLEMTGVGLPGARDTEKASPGPMLALEAGTPVVV